MCVFFFYFIYLLACAASELNTGIVRMRRRLYIYLFIKLFVQVQLVTLVILGCRGRLVMLALRVNPDFQAREASLVRLEKRVPWGPQVPPALMATRELKETSVRQVWSRRSRVQLQTDD